jgi:hypothetical protein
MFGASPQIMVGGTAKNLKTMHQILETEEWLALKSQLLGLVENYDQKVIKAAGGFQL